MNVTSSSLKGQPVTPGLVVPVVAVVLVEVELLLLVELLVLVELLELVLVLVVVVVLVVEVAAVAIAMVNIPPDSVTRAPLVEPTT